MNRTITHLRPARRVNALAILLTLAAAMSLTACANPGSITCSEYAAKSRSDRTATQKALLGAHDLEPNAMGNALGIQKAINSYCGVNGITQTDPATKNASSTLEKAVNWSAKSW